MHIATVGSFERLFQLLLEISSCGKHTRLTCWIAVYVLVRAMVQHSLLALAELQVLMHLPEKIQNANTKSDHELKPTLNSKAALEKLSGRRSLTNDMAHNSRARFPDGTQKRR
jgi:hypothetical protein